MKKILLIGLILGLVGCRDGGTRLEKTVFNTTSEKCLNYLSQSLKSPSSLKVDKINISTYIPSAFESSSVFGDLIISNGVVKEHEKNNKLRFRALSVDIDYEAQNSYGASLRGMFQCKYMYALYKSETSPEALNVYLYSLVNDGEEIILPTSIPISSFSGSNLYLNKEIKQIVGAEDNLFTKLDEEKYKELENQYKLLSQQREAERLRQSWNSSL